jgi:ABC-type multidrug transport system ATPase subunit/CRP-like cAMP-binding protein/ABC-type multidrug transport system permease subunit
LGPSADLHERFRHSILSVPWLAGLRQDELESLERQVELREFAAGETIIRQGDRGASMYIVIDGAVDIVRWQGGREKTIRRLGPGDLFGEMALVTGDPRSASVVAAGPVRVACLRREQYHALVRSRPALDDEVRRIAAARLVELLGARPGQALAVLAGERPLRIGSDEGVEVVLGEHGVAPVHASLQPNGAGWTIADQGSAAGTLLNREPVEEATLGEGDRLRLGAARLLVAEGVLYAAAEGSGVSVEAQGVTIMAGERALLKDVSLAFEPGELVAIIGPSGAGKTTLLNALLGLRPITSGEIRFDGVPFAADPARVRAILGYVPQYDIVHQELTVRESLRFAARLRVPGLAGRELDERIQGLLARLHLEAQADLLVGRLSGGQRKRACIAAELLTNPGVVFLDEPTSGLDPGLDAALMLQLRELADEGRTIVITTHATRNIRLCDRVVVVNRGHVIFDGTPSEAIAHFGVEDFAEVYAAVGDPEQDGARFRETAAYRRQQALLGAERVRRPATEAARVPAMPGPVRQFWQLARRNVRILSRDRANLVLRVAGAPLLAALLLGSFDSTVFAVSRADGGNAQQAVILLYLASAITLFLGAFTSANAITSESGVFRRERLVGLSPPAYVLAKVGVAGLFSLLQGLVFVAVLAIKIDFPSPAWETGMLLGTVLSLVSFAGMSMGMFISALSANADRAAILVVLALIPQLIFAGASVPKSQMSPISEVVSQVTITKWALELSGSLTGLEDRLAAQSIQRVRVAGQTAPVEVQAEYRPYEGAFAINEASRWSVLAGFSVVLVAGTIAAQTWRYRPARRQS